MFGNILMSVFCVIYCMIDVIYYMIEAMMIALYTYVF